MGNPIVEGAFLRGLQAANASRERVTTQIKRVSSLDIDGSRTRVYFEPDPLHSTIDILTLTGMCYSAIPGTRLRVTVEIVEEEG